MAFADKLKELRKTRKMTQEELASEIYISRPMIAKYETGKAYPTNEILQRIADFFEVSVEELVQREELIDEHSKILEKRTIENNKLIIMIAIVGILILAIVAILYVVEVQYTETAVDFVMVEWDAEFERWKVIYLEESNPDIWHRKEYIYLSEYQPNSYNDTTRFTVDGNRWFEGVYYAPDELKSATLYYHVTVKKNLLGFVQGKGYYLEKVDFHLVK